MLPRNHLDRIHITFDDHRLVNNAGLLLFCGPTQNGCAREEETQECINYVVAPHRTRRIPMTPRSRPLETRPARPRT